MIFWKCSKSEVCFYDHSPQCMPHNKRETGVHNFDNFGRFLVLTFKLLHRHTSFSAIQHRYGISIR